MKVTFISGLVVAALVGCTSSSTSGEIDAGTARQTASAAVPGTVAEPVLLDEGEEHRWVVEVALANGAAVRVEITRTTGVLEEVKSEWGPYDYDLPAPAAGLMTFAQAKEKALAAKKGAVELWEVKPPTNLYEFYVRDSDDRLWEVKMTGDKGEVTSVIEKAKAD